jgi:regulator of replication initiation timing
MNKAIIVISVLIAIAVSLPVGIVIGIHLGHYKIGQLPKLESKLDNYEKEIENYKQQLIVIELDNSKLKEDNERLVVSQRKLKTQLQNIKVPVTESAKNDNEIRIPSISAQSSIWSDAILDVQMLSSEKPYSGRVEFNFSIKNASSRFRIEYYEITMVLFDKDGDYISRDYANGQTLNPSEMKYDNFGFDDISLSQISKYKLTLDQVSVSGSGGDYIDATKYYRINMLE